MITRKTIENYIQNELDKRVVEWLKSLNAEQLITVWNDNVGHSDKVYIGIREVIKNGFNSVYMLTQAIVDGDVKSMYSNYFVIEDRDKLYSFENITDELCPINNDRLASVLISQEVLSNTDFFLWLMSKVREKEY